MIILLTILGSGIAGTTTPPPDPEPGTVHEVMFNGEAVTYNGEQVTFTE